MITLEQTKMGFFPAIDLSSSHCPIPTAAILALPPAHTPSSSSTGRRSPAICRSCDWQTSLASSVAATATATSENGHRSTTLLLLGSSPVTGAPPTDVNPAAAACPRWGTIWRRCRPPAARRRSADRGVAAGHCRQPHRPHPA